MTTFFLMFVCFIPLSYKFLPSSCTHPQFPHFLCCPQLYTISHLSYLHHYQYLYHQQITAYGGYLRYTVSYSTSQSRGNAIVDSDVELSVSTIFTLAMFPWNKFVTLLAVFFVALLDYFLSLNGIKKRKEKNSVLLVNLNRSRRGIITKVTL